MASTFYTAQWQATYKTYTRQFRGWFTYDWYPNHSPTQARLVIYSHGVEKIPTGKTTWEQSTGTFRFTNAYTRTYTRNCKTNVITFASTANSQVTMETINANIYFDKYDSSARTIYVDYAISKDDSVWKGSGSGRLPLTVPAKTTYAINYYANNGVNPPGSQSKIHGQTVTIKGAESMTRTGYTFVNWNTLANPTLDNPGDAYGPNTANTTYSTDTPLALYAQWTPNTYTVSYDSNGGSGTMADSTFTYDTSNTLRANTFTRANYMFAGWATTSDSTTVTYVETEGTPATITTNLSTGAPVTLYAVWKYIYEPPVIQNCLSTRATWKDTNTIENDDAGVAAIILPSIIPGSKYTSLTNKDYTYTLVEVYYQLATDSTGTPTRIPFLVSTSPKAIADGQIITNAAAISSWRLPQRDSNDPDDFPSIQFDTGSQYNIIVKAYTLDSNSLNANCMAEAENYIDFISVAEFIIDFDPEGESIGIFTIATGGVTDSITNETVKIVYLNGDIALMLDDDQDNSLDNSILNSLQRLRWDTDIDSNIGG